MRVRATLLFTVCTCSFLGLAPYSDISAQSRTSRARVTPAVNLTTDVSLFNVTPVMRNVSVELADVSLIDALNEIAAAGGVHLIYSPELIPAGQLLTISLRDTPAIEAIRRALAGQPVRMLSRRNMVVLVGNDRRRPAATPVKRLLVGVVAGQVTDAATGAALPDVSVVIEETGRGGLTDAAGRFRITDVPAGPQQVSAISVGYRTDTRGIDVPDGGVVEVDFALEETVIELDEMVVTGSLAETRIRELSNPIDVISGQEIERKNINRLDELFRGEIPGAVSFNNGGFDFYYNEIIVRGTSRLGGGEYIKTYIDGVEMSQPLWNALVDPSNVERVEIVRGPQASTLYGSEATGGVMQIFTKKGADNGLDRPTFNVSLSAGALESDYGDGTTLTQDHTFGFSGGGPSFSYHVGGGYYARGAYTVNSYVNKTTANAGLNIAQGDFDLQLSARYVKADFDTGVPPILREVGVPIYANDRIRRFEQSQPGLGLTLNYTPFENWTHQVVVGQDRLAAPSYEEPLFTTPADTLYKNIGVGGSVKTSIRYQTSLGLSLGEGMSSNVTVGADHYDYLNSGGFVEQAPTLQGAFSSDIGFIARSAWKNTGFFAQNILGVNDKVFVTLGIRAEDNENFGNDFGTAWSPRAGVSVVHSIGSIGAKVRAQWGQALRAPSPFHSQRSSTATSETVPNVNIGPEKNRGWDAGVELYLGDRASIDVTYYDQTAVDLIDRVTIGVDPILTYQYQNTGEIQNQGWEISGKLDLYPFSFRGTYSINDSEVLKTSPTYTGDLQPGDQSLAIPEYSAGFTAGVRFLRGYADFSMTHIGPWIAEDWVALYGFYYGGDDYRGSGRDYWIDYDPVTRFNLNVSQNLNERLTAFLKMDNVTNKQLGEHDNTTTTVGRTTMIGLRFVY